MYYQYILKSHVLKNVGGQRRYAGVLLLCCRLIFIGKEREKVQKLTRGLASKRTIMKRKKRN